MIRSNKFNVIIYLNEEDLDSLGWFFEVVGFLFLFSIFFTSCTIFFGTSVNISGGIWDNFFGIWVIILCIEEVDFIFFKLKGWKLIIVWYLKRFLYFFLK